MSRASQHPSERDRPGLQMALAALERRERIYPGAAGIPRLLLEQISNPYTVLEPSYDALQAERDQLRAQVEEQLPRLIDENHKLRAELDAIRGQEPSLDKWAEYKAKFCGCKDASRHNSCRGLATCQLPIGHPERKVEYLPPQQPDAVSVPRELEALQAECDNLRISLKDADHGMVLFMQQRDELLQELEAIKRPGQVRVPEYLLQRALRADASKGAGPAQLLDGWAAMEELRSLLSTRQAEEGE